MLVLYSVIQYSPCFLCLLSSLQIHCYHCSWLPQLYQMFQMALLPLSSLVFTMVLTFINIKKCFWIFLDVYVPWKIKNSSLQYLKLNSLFCQKGSKATSYHLIVSEHKGHISEVVAAFLIIAEPSLIRDVPC